jgi:ABC-2 type transport system ATP-binding protein
MARTRLTRLGIPLDKKVDALSGGQKAQVALALALAKQPDLLLLDEPVASLDPLARREFLRGLSEAAAEGLTVLLSSHIIGDLERVCDYLIILSASRVQLAGDIAELVAQHKTLVGPRAEAEAISRGHGVIQASHAGPTATLLVRANGHPVATSRSWTVYDVHLEELVLAYLGRQGQDALTPAPLGKEEVGA